jgi:hypothetical protein
MQYVYMNNDKQYYAPLIRIQHLSASVFVIGSTQLAIICKFIQQEVVLLCRLVDIVFT